jgi:hypothetical protein
MHRAGLGWGKKILDTSIITLWLLHTAYQTGSKRLLEKFWVVILGTYQPTLTRLTGVGF